MDKKNEAVKCYERAENGKDKEGYFCLIFYRFGSTLIGKVIRVNGI